MLFLGLLVVHLHLFCDLIGSRGPQPADLWSVPYLAPLSTSWTLVWDGQWRLVGPENIAIAAVLLTLALLLPLRLGHSAATLLGRKADTVFVGTLRKWHSAIRSGRRKSLVSDGASAEARQAR